MTKPKVSSDWVTYHPQVSLCGESSAFYRRIGDCLEIQGMGECNKIEEIILDAGLTIDITQFQGFFNECREYLIDVPARHTLGQKLMAFLRRQVLPKTKRSRGFYLNGSIPEGSLNPVLIKTSWRKIIPIVPYKEEG